jgi:hypothetical protein
VEDAEPAALRTTKLVRSSFQHFVWPDVAADEPEQV